MALPRRIILNRGAYDADNLAGVQTDPTERYKFGSIVTHSNFTWMCVVPDLGPDGTNNETGATTAPSATSADWIRLDGEFFRTGAADVDDDNSAGALILDANNEWSVNTDALPLDALANVTGIWNRATVDDRLAGTVLVWRDQLNADEGITQDTLDRFGGGWVPLQLGLSDLVDVNYPPGEPDAGDILVWDGTNNRFEPQPPTPAGISTVVTDATITGTGITGSPLSVAIPFTQPASDKLAAIVVDTTARTVNDGDGNTITVPPAVTEGNGIDVTNGVVTAVADPGDGLVVTSAGIAVDHARVASLYRATREYAIGDGVFFDVGPGLSEGRVRSAWYSTNIIVAAEDRRPPFLQPFIPGNYVQGDFANNAAGTVLYERTSAIAVTPTGTTGANAIPSHTGNGTEMNGWTVRGTSTAWEELTIDTPGTSGADLTSLVGGPGVRVIQPTGTETRTLVDASLTDNGGLQFSGDGTTVGETIEVDYDQVRTDIVRQFTAEADGADNRANIAIGEIFTLGASTVAIGSVTPKASARTFMRTGTSVANLDPAGTTEAELVHDGMNVSWERFYDATASHDLSDLGYIELTDALIGQPAENFTRAQIDADAAAAVADRTDIIAHAGTMLNVEGEGLYLTLVDVNGNHSLTPSEITGAVDTAAIPRFRRVDPGPSVIPPAPGESGITRIQDATDVFHGEFESGQILTTQVTNGETAFVVRNHSTPDYISGKNYFSGDEVKIPNPDGDGFHYYGAVHVTTSSPLANDGDWRRTDLNNDDVDIEIAAYNTRVNIPHIEETHTTTYNDTFTLVNRQNNVGTAGTSNNDFAVTTSTAQTIVSIEGGAANANAAAIQTAFGVDVSGLDFQTAEVSPPVTVALDIPAQPDTPLTVTVHTIEREPNVIPGAVVPNSFRAANVGGAGFDNWSALARVGATNRKMLYVDKQDSTAFADREVFRHSVWNRNRGATAQINDSLPTPTQTFDSPHNTEISFSSVWLLLNNAPEGNLTNRPLGGEIIQAGGAAPVFNVPPGAIQVWGETGNAGVNARNQTRRLSITYRIPTNNSLNTRVRGYEFGIASPVSGNLGVPSQAHSIATESDLNGMQNDLANALETHRGNVKAIVFQQIPVDINHGIHYPSMQRVTIGLDAADASNTITYDAAPSLDGYQSRPDGGPANLDSTSAVGVRPINTLWFNEVWEHPASGAPIKVWPAQDPNDLPDDTFRLRLALRLTERNVRHTEPSGLVHTNAATYRVEPIGWNNLSNADQTTNLNEAVTAISGAGGSSRLEFRLTEARWTGGNFAADSGRSAYIGSGSTSITSFPAREMATVLPETFYRLRCFNNQTTREFIIANGGMQDPNNAVFYGWTSAQATALADVTTTDSRNLVTPNGTTINISGQGTVVEANPGGTDGDDLNRIRIGGVNYDIPSSVPTYTGTPIRQIAGNSNITIGTSGANTGLLTFNFPTGGGIPTTVHATEAELNAIPGLASGTVALYDGPIFGYGYQQVFISSQRPRMFVGNVNRPSTHPLYIPDTNLTATMQAREWTLTSTVSQTTGGHVRTVGTRVPLGSSAPFFGNGFPIQLVFGAGTTGGTPTSTRIVNIGAFAGTNGSGAPLDVDAEGFMVFDNGTDLTGAQATFSAATAVEIRAPQRLVRPGIVFYNGTEWRNG